jgi:hypothetical protein
MPTWKLRGNGGGKHPGDVPVIAAELRYDKALNMSPSPEPAS